MSTIEVDIVKRGYMKYKTSTQTSKSSKEYWCMFRTGQTIQDRAIEFYQNEKDSQKKNATPKNFLFMRSIHSVAVIEQKSFHVYSSDGTVHMFETHSSHEAREWVFTLNAILFGRGPDGRQVLRFNIEVWSCPQFRYSGPGLLEVRDDQVIVWSHNEVMEVVRWQLGHIRSFKAKQNQLQIVAGSRSSTGEGIFVFGTQESILITHTLETVIYQLAERKRNKKTTPPISASPQNHAPSSTPWYKQTLVRGRTDTKDAIPGFTDIPGMRGPDSSITNEVKFYSTTNHTPSDHAPHLGVQRTPSRSLSAKQINQASSGFNGEYSLLRPQYTGGGGGISKSSSDIYSDIPNQPQQTTKPKGKHQTLPARGTEYQYTDTKPQLLPLSKEKMKGTEIGEIRHVRSRGNSPTEDRPHPNQGGDGEIYSTIPESEGYAFLNPTEMPQPSSEFYNSLDFNNTTEDELAPPTSVYHTTQHPTTGFKRPAKRSGYEEIDEMRISSSPTKPIPRIKESNYDQLAPLPFPPASNSEENENIEIFYEAPPLPPPPTEVSLAELELHYEVSPVLVRKEMLQNKSPRTSPKPQRKQGGMVSPYNPYDEVPLDDPHTPPTHHVIETGGEYSKFDRNTNNIPIEGHETYNCLSFNNSEDTSQYNVLHRGTTPSTLPLFDGDYSELPNALHNPDPDIKIHNTTTPSKPPDPLKPAVPPRKGRVVTPTPSNMTTPPSSNVTSPVSEKPSNITEDHNNRPVVPPKPKPKPKRTFVVE